jgi:hypothetical protein
MIEVNFSEYKRLNASCPNVTDIYGQKYLILDGVLLIIRPSTEDYIDHKEEIEKDLFGIPAVSSNTTE